MYNVSKIFLCCYFDGGGGGGGNVCDVVKVVVCGCGCDCDFGVEGCCDAAAGCFT